MYTAPLSSTVAIETEEISLSLRVVEVVALAGATPGDADAGTESTSSTEDSCCRGWRRKALRKTAKRRPAALALPLDVRPADVHRPRWSRRHYSSMYSCCSSDSESESSDDDDTREQEDLSMLWTHL